MSTGVIAALSVLGSIVLVAVGTFFVMAHMAERRRAFLNAKPSATANKSDMAGRAWVIVNPTKVGSYAEFQQKVSNAVILATGRPAMWIETTVEDPGTGQAIEALKYRPSLVMAAGGDGTVRAVAAGMAHSRVPMALLPMGTGNLLARNIGVPLDLDKALDTALEPVSRRMDLAWLRLERVSVASDLPAEGDLLRRAGASAVRVLPDGVNEPAKDEYAYTVIAGVGFDGQTMVDTDPSLKKWIGWTAYVLAALKSLRIERMKATVTVFHKEGESAGDFKSRRSAPIPKAVETAVRQSHTLGADKGVSPALKKEETWDMTGVRARTILFANCGVLPFAVLAPDASIDDGKMDLIALDTRAGLLGWSYLTIKVAGQSVGLKPINLKNDLGAIQFRQTSSARVDISKAYPVQVDGDPVGEARTVSVRVDKGALIVRAPKNTAGAIPDEDRRI
ncbi:diacylglycerol kinase family protein [Actinomycetaceae bacterium MB13-C1-2]|nr:diacylglycerol kinase family protein [Actinomycetaceae bacterium MB13-C1-2]